MATRETHHPVTSLLTAVVSEVAYLLQTELRLARTEIKEKISQLSNGAALLGIAAALVIPGLVILFMAIGRWLVVAGMSEEWALTVVGIVVLLVGGGMAMAGINALKASSLVPEKTLEQVRADFTIAKEQVQ
jgi:uncharacterized membrane protein YqjE